MEPISIFSMVYLASYHLLVLLVPFGVWEWWIKKHADNLETAFVPNIVVITMLSLF